MGIETENELRSVVEIPGLAVNPVPGGEIDAGDLQATCWIYSGLTLPITEIIKKFLMQILQMDSGRPGIHQLKGIEDDKSIYTFPLGIGGEATLPTPSGGIFLPGSTRLELMDIPILRDADDDAGFYAAVTGFTSHWRGAVIFKSNDGGETWEEIETITTEAPIGFADDVLPSGPTTVFDNTSTVTIQLTRGALFSESKINVLNGAQACLLGTEVLQFIDATDLGGDKFLLGGGMLRGRRGTEWAVGTHVKNDRFVMLSEGGLARIEADSSELGLTRHYRAVSIGNSIEDAAIFAFTNNGVGLKPYSPVHIAGSRDGPGNLTTTWIPRTRVGGAWRDLSDVPLGEDSEDYEVDILSGATVVRTITKTASAGGSVVTPASQQSLYTDTDQISDFGSVQSSIDQEVFQLSATVGRGYKGEATI